jgi:hypothetical protein
MRAATDKNDTRPSAGAFREPDMKEWIDAALRDIRPANFAAKAGGAFDDPVGAIVRSQLPLLFEYVVAGAAASPGSDVIDALDAVMRLRAVQVSDPDEAVRFVEALEHDVTVAPAERAPAVARMRTIAEIGRRLFVEHRRRLDDIRSRAAARLDYLPRRRAQR